MSHQHDSQPRQGSTNGIGVVKEVTRYFHHLTRSLLGLLQNQYLQEESAKARDTTSSVIVPPNTMTPGPTAPSATPADTTIPDTTIPSKGAPGMTTPSTCIFLSKLPAEMRNNTYALVFDASNDPHTDAEGRVDLLRAKAPSKDLLLTCKEIYHEARGIYKYKYRQFWSSSDFVVDRTLSVSTKAEIEALPALDLDHITSLQIRGHFDDSISWSTSFILAHRIWKTCIAGFERYAYATTWAPLKTSGFKHMQVILTRKWEKAVKEAARVEPAIPQHLQIVDMTLLAMRRHVDDFEVSQG